MGIDLDAAGRFAEIVTNMARAVDQATEGRKIAWAIVAIDKETGGTVVLFPPEVIAQAVLQTGLDHVKTVEGIFGAGKTRADA